MYYFINFHYLLLSFPCWFAWSEEHQALLLQPVGGINLS